MKIAAWNVNSVRARLDRLKNLGLRIDHIFATERLVGAGVDREARKGKQPSDHAPVWAEFKD